jgi:hypothetical protein
MDGRAFLEPARDLVGGKTEAYWRGAVVHAYYALMLECRDALRRWGFTIPPRQNVHPWVRLKLLYAKDADLKRIGVELDLMAQLRNEASYDLTSSSFTSTTSAQNTLQRATDAITLLDSIENDPARRAAAIAAIPP